MNKEASEGVLLRKSRDLAAALKRHDRKLVFAESCTAGLLASSLSRIPGISNHFCGSMVTYRNASKSEWLGVDEDALNSPEVGPVSEIVATQMAVGVLGKTPEADIAVSVTGHLGPNAPGSLDGVAFVAILFREDNVPQVTQLALVESTGDEAGLRRDRQVDAAIQVVQSVLVKIDRHL